MNFCVPFTSKNDIFRVCVLVLVSSIDQIHKSHNTPGPCVTNTKRFLIKSFKQKAWLWLADAKTCIKALGVTVCCIKCCWTYYHYHLYNVCTRVADCFSTHKRVILVFISWVAKQLKSAYIILFLTWHNKDKNDDLLTSTPFLTRWVYVLLMSSQSIIDDVTITRQLRQFRVLCWHCLPPGSLHVLGAFGSLSQSQISFKVI